MIHYKLNRGSFDHAELGAYVSYGLTAYDENEQLLQTISDISTSEQAVSALVSLCNKLQVSLIHMDDIVADFLA